MTTIHMETEQVRLTAQQLGDSANQMLAAASNLRSTLGRLSIAWQGDSAEEYQNVLWDWLQHFEVQIEQLHNLAQQTTSEVNEWDRANASLSRGTFSSPVIPPVPVPVPAPIPSPVPLDISDLNRLLRSIAALKPLVIEELLKKMGLETIKDLLDLKELVRLNQEWDKFASQFGQNSFQAEEARNELWKKCLTEIPGVGTIIEVLFKVAEANPVE